jgi:F-type H+-transporting ATPase subunit epsilon
VDVPGTEGDMGIYPMHAPLMAAIRTGIINVYLSDENVKFFVQGGFADVTTGELIILAEKACLIDDIDREEIKNDIEFAKESLVSLEGEAALSMQQNLDGLQYVLAN